MLLNTKNWTTSSPAGSLAISSFPSPTTAGVAGNFTVTAYNSNGTIDTGYTGTVHFTSSDPQAVLPADYTFTAADAGVDTFSATLKTAGTQSITVTETAMSTITGKDTGITVNPAAASKFIITAPSSVPAGVAFALTVKVEDTYGNVVTGYRGTIRISSVNGQGNLPSTYTFTTKDNGVHTFAGVVLNKRAKHIITMTDTLDGTIVSSVIVDVL